MLKKIFRVFFVLFSILILLGVYFYIFPTYPNYQISDEYFHTRFHEQGFDSPQNGFQEWKDLIESLDENAGIISEFDMYYKCYLQNNCLGDLRDISGEEKEKILEIFLSDTKKQQDFGNVVNDFLSKFEDITKEHSFISTLNYSRTSEGSIPVGPELLIYTKMIQFSRGIIFYNHYVGEKERIKNTVLWYKNISWLSHYSDDSIISALVIITVLKNQFEYIEENYEGFSPVVKKIILKSLEENLLSNSMIQNGIKGEHQYGEIIINHLYHNSLDNVNQENGTSLKSFLFFDLEDTINIMRKVDSDKIEGVCNDTWVKLNGKNWIGRILAQGWGTCMTSQLKKQQDILNKRQQLIQLLSN